MEHPSSDFASLSHLLPQGEKGGWRSPLAEGGDHFFLFAAQRPEAGGGGGGGVFGGAPGPLVGLFTGDEEIGSPEGRPVIEAEAKNARVVFNSEPGRASGNVVKARKGGVFSVVDIEGKAAHSGGNFEAGISAIGEAANKIVAIHALTDLNRGITLNVGLIQGGQSVNTTAPNCQFQIDLRYIEPADRDEIMGKIHDIVARAYEPGTKSVLNIKGELLPRKPTPASERGFKTYQAAAACT
ncbi:MAG: peptidase dimerization domain-containing protein, partial [Rhizobiaceae bacterium]|nr:peptidase dimerization domain-containing protein [Rhizobiaceae bacterium]